MEKVKTYRNVVAKATPISQVFKNDAFIDGPSFILKVSLFFILFYFFLLSLFLYYLSKLSAEANTICFRSLLRKYFQ